MFGVSIQQQTSDVKWNEQHFFNPQFCEVEYLFTLDGDHVHLWDLPLLDQERIKLYRSRFIQEIRDTVMWEVVRRAYGDKMEISNCINLANFYYKPINENEVIKDSAGLKNKSHADPSAFNQDDEGQFDCLRDRAKITRKFWELVQQGRVLDSCFSHEDSCQ